MAWCGKKKRIENVVEETKTEPPTKKLKRNEPAEKLEKEKPKVYEEEGETEVKKSSSSKKKTKNVDTAVPKPKSYESLGKGPPPFPSTGKKYVGCHVEYIIFCFENGKLSNASSIALFLRNQRSWNAKPLDEETVTKWNEMIGDFPPHLILPHGSYLMNLGCPKEETLQKSRKLFVEELQRCEKLGIPHFNFHPGSTLGVISREECCKLIAESINLGHKETSSVICVIENMSCQGFTVGGDFHEIRLIIEGVQDKSRVGVCLDTCHAHAAGYDLSSEKGFHNMVTDFEKIIGWQFLRGLHLNDSKGKAGDHKDRHEVIGKGYIGKEGFERVMNYPKFNDMPLILETPFVSEDQYAKEIKLLQSLIE
ncbi:putative endonuclease 4 [Armadillidium nasatum]|uniref:Putative endonuclease 4 n=1 Tax=Armadillidium nasatum TaxID=96803 RepID=A0A5N5SK81_9CRUS|nr:putative endonuclease 4 [Armadillidium nasatum]